MFSAATKSGKNATGGVVVTDPQFPYVTTLLHGDGTNGAQNNTFIDSSTNNFTITRSGNTTQGSLSPYGANWSNYFDGTGDYLTVPSNAAMTFGTGDFTVEFWVYLPAVPSNFPPIISSGSTGNFYINFRGSGVIGLTDAGTVYAVTPSALTANSWFHVAVVRNSGSSKIYLNGTGGTAVACTVNWSTNSIFNIASDVNATLNAYISNLRVLKGTALYTANFTPSTTPLTPITNTSLLTCQSPSLIDNSPNAFAITKAGDVSVQRFSPFSPVTQTPTSYSGLFDGNGDYLTCPATVPASGAFTVEMWVYPTLQNSFQILLSQYATSVNQSLLITWSDGNLRKFGLTIGVTSILTSTNTFALNNWYHVAITRNTSAVMTLWVNGVSEATATNGTTLYQATTFIGIRSTGDGYFNGNISNVRVTNTTVYTSAFTPPTTPLTAITGTTLLTCQSPTFIDNSTSALAITAFGDAKPRAFNPFGFTNTLTTGYSTAVNGGSAYFDGTGDNLSIANNAAFNFGSGAFTVEAWVYFNGVSTAQSIITNYGGSTTGWAIQISGGVYIVNLSGDGADITGSAAVANTWNHVAVSGSSGSIKLFVNGTQQGSTFTGAVSLDTSAALTIGSLLTLNYVAGYISNVRLVKGTALYTSNFVPPLAPTTAITNTSLLLNATNAGIFDNSMINNFETTGNAQISTTVKKYGTGSIAFDGTGDYLISPYKPIFSLPGNFTVEAWIYLTSASGSGSNQTIASFNYNNSTGAGPWGFYLNGNGPYTLYFNTQGANHNTSTTVAVPLSTWTHIAYSRSSSVGRFFVNGTKIGTDVTDTSVYTGTSGSLYVGIMSDITSAPLFGYMDDLRITNGYSRYNANFTPPTEAFPNS